MAITESDQKVMRDLFMDAAGDLLAKERELVGHLLAPMASRLGAVEARLAALEGQVSGLVRLDAVEKRLAALEAVARH